MDNRNWTWIIIMFVVMLVSLMLVSIGSIIAGVIAMTALGVLVSLLTDGLELDQPDPETWVHIWRDQA